MRRRSSLQKINLSSMSGFEWLAHGMTWIVELGPMRNSTGPPATEVEPRAMCLAAYRAKYDFSSPAPLELREIRLLVETVFTHPHATPVDAAAWRPPLPAAASGGRTGGCGGTGRAMATTDAFLPLPSPLCLPLLPLVSHAPCSITHGKAPGQVLFQSRSKKDPVTRNRLAGAAIPAKV